MRTDAVVPRELDAAERALAVIEMRRQFLTFDEISKRLGISRQACHAAYKKAIKAVLKEQKAGSAQLLARELDTLENMRRVALEIVNDKDADPKDRLVAMKQVTDNVIAVTKMTGISAPISIETKNLSVTADLTPDQMKRMATLLNEAHLVNGDD
jgi:DNA-binding Lrp family transcriptional regulator